MGEVHDSPYLDSPPTTMQPLSTLESQVRSLRQQVQSTETQLRNLKLQLQQAEQQCESSRQLEQAWAGGYPQDWITETLAALSPEAQQQNGNPAQPKTTHGRWPLESEEYKRYGRQMILPEVGLHGQLRLKNAKVLLVGVGGLGCPAAAYLAGAGVGTIGLMDGDTVEISNLHRQVAHGTERVGMSKVDSAVEYLMSYVSVVSSIHSPIHPTNYSHHVHPSIHPESHLALTTYQQQPQPKPNLQPPPLPPNPANRHRDFYPIRPRPRLHRPPNISLPDLRRLRPNQQTTRFRLSAQNRRPTNRPQQPPSPAWQPLNSRRRALLPLRLPQTASSRQRAKLWRRRDPRPRRRPHGSLTSARSDQTHRRQTTSHRRLHFPASGTSQTHPPDVLSLQLPTLPLRPLALETRRLRRLFPASHHHPGQPDKRQPRLHRLLRHLSSHQRPPPLSPHLGYRFRAIA